DRVNNGHSNAACRWRVTTAARPKPENAEGSWRGSDDDHDHQTDDQCRTPGRYQGPVASRTEREVPHGPLESRGGSVDRCNVDGGLACGSGHASETGPG